MSNQLFHRDILDPGNDNSDVSEVDAEDLEKIVKGVDDIDNALFGFKTKTDSSQIAKTTLNEPKFQQSVMKTSQLKDLPDGDLLADISLSDDDFYDLDKKSSLTPKKEVKAPESPKLSSLDKLSKAKKIADLFGLDEEEDQTTVNIKKTEGAADWLGIKDSPEKKVVDFGNKSEIFGSQLDVGPLNKIETEVKKDELITAPIKPNISSGNGPESKLNTPAINISLENKKEVKSRPKSGEIFDILDDKRDTTGSELLKDKKSGIFEELFGESNVRKKSLSRRNSIVKTPETNVEPSAMEESSLTLGEYKPSSVATRRPGLTRRRDPATPTPASFLFQDDWLENSAPEQVKKKEPETVKTEMKPASSNTNEGLPAWLGGSGLSKDSKIQEKQTTEEIRELSTQVKVAPERLPVVKQEVPAGEETDLKQEDQTVESFKKTLARNVETDEETTMALQRTEAQLLSALQLQTTQSELSAVCARQRALLHHQEQQLTQLIQHQASRQADTEKQLTAQQLKIKHLLEVLTANLSPEIIKTSNLNDLPQENWNNQKQQQDDNNFQVELQHLTLEKEELNLRMQLIEKHHKMELESMQVIHQREIESWQNQLSSQKELSNQIIDDFKERLKTLKESEAEVMIQHQQRVERLRQEHADDVDRLMQFHRATLDQLSVVGQLMLPTARENLKPKEIAVRPLEDHELSEKEQELLKKEKLLTALQEKLEDKKLSFEKETDDKDKKLEQEKMRNEEIARQLKQEQTQIRYKQQQLENDRKHLDEQNFAQRKILEEMQEKIMQERTKLATEQLTLAEERAKLEALAKLQGVSGSATFDVLQAKAEVHGALEAARAAELQANEERNKLREKERSLENYRWKLKNMEEDLVARAEHLDRLMQVSEANQQAGQKAFEEAKRMEKCAEEKMAEVERRKVEIHEKEKSLIKAKLEIAHEEIMINRKRQHLEHVLPALSSEEAFSLHPVRDVIDPKMLIMRLRAEREFEAGAQTSKTPFQTSDANL